MAALDTTALVASVVRDASIPTGSRFTTAVLLQMANEIQVKTILPLLATMTGGYITARKEITLVAGQAEYRLPARAARIRNIQFRDSSGKLSSIDEMSDEDRPFLSQDSGRPTEWYLEGNLIIINPALSTVAGETLKVVYDQFPSRLVTTSSVAVVASFVPATKVITTSATVPATFSTSRRYNLVRAKGPSFECLAINQVATTASGTNVTLSSALPGDLEAGDYVALAEETCVPQFHPVLHTALQHLITAAVHKAQGHTSKMQAEMNDFQAASENARLLLSPRSKGVPRTCVQRYW